MPYLHPRPRNPWKTTAAARAARTAALALLLFTGRAQAQWIGSFSFDNGYASNAFGLSSAGAASLTGFGAAFGYVPEDATWSAVYSGTLALIPQFPDQQYSMHALTLSWELPADSAQALHLTAATGVSSRFGRETYTLYDYWQGAAQTGLKYGLADNLVARADYRFRTRLYPQFRSLGFLEHAPSLGASLTLETKTSIHTDVFYGRKQFLSSGAGTVVLPTSSAAPAAGILTVEGGGPGGGGNGGGGNGGGGNGNGNGMHAGGAASAPILAFDIPSLSQAGVRVTIGQALTDAVGLGLKYQRRWNLDGDMHAIVAGVLNSGGDDELIDDPFSYSGDEYSATLTSILPWSMTMKTSASAHLKSYPYAASLDVALGGPDRRDRRYGSSLSIEKAIDASWLFLDSPTITLAYQYIRNQSNASIFDYAAHAVSLGIEVGW